MNDEMTSLAARAETQDLGLLSIWRQLCKADTGRSEVMLVFQIDVCLSTGSVYMECVLYAGERLKALDGNTYLNTCTPIRERATSLPELHITI